MSAVIERAGLFDLDREVQLLAVDAGVAVERERKLVRVSVERRGVGDMNRKRSARRRIAEQIELDGARATDRNVNGAGAELEPAAEVDLRSVGKNGCCI